MNTIGKNINILYRQFNLFLNHELSGVELNSTDLMYLGTLFIEDGVTQDDLAKDFCVDKAATARSMQNLEKKGIIIRKPDESDRRAKRVYLTDKAYKYKPLMESIQKKWMKICNTPMNDEEVIQFEKNLEIITEHVKLINGIDDREGQ